MALGGFDGPVGTLVNDLRQQIDARDAEIHRLRQALKAAREAIDVAINETARMRSRFEHQRAATARAFRGETT
jgi:outer membrane murein-binding lipoprotein Lpp